MIDITIEGVRLELSRKPVKYLRIVVAPPDGDVRVSAPRHWPEHAVHAALLARLPWIRRQLAYFSAQPRRAPPLFADGECHRVWGEDRRLELICTRGGARIEATDDGRLRMLLRSGTDPARRERLLNAWYRSQLQERIAAELDHWQQALGVSVSTWGIKRMRTRWGTCNITARRIWLNLALAQLPPECCRYVLVHELAHLLERYHNAHFWSILDQHLPEWRAARTRLTEFDLQF